MSTTPFSEPISQEEGRDILLRTRADTMDLFRQIKEDLGGVVPMEWSYGVVAGYIRGRGYTWKEAMVVMNRWIDTMNSMNNARETDSTTATNTEGGAQ